MSDVQYDEVKTRKQGKIFTLTRRNKKVDINESAELISFGQEFNPETFAIAKADMLIKGGNADGMKYGDTLNDDKFSGQEFDYIISNPPLSII